MIDWNVFGFMRCHRPDDFFCQGAKDPSVCASAATSPLQGEDPVVFAVRSGSSASTYSF